MAFAVGAVFEIKRLVDFDRESHSAQGEIVSAPVPAEPRVYDPTPEPVPAGADQSKEVSGLRVPTDTREIVVPDGSTSSAVVQVEKDVVTAAAENLESEVLPAVTRAKRTGGRRKRASAA